MIVPRVFKSRQRKRKNISIVLSSQKTLRFFLSVFSFCLQLPTRERRELYRPSFCAAKRNIKWDRSRSEQTGQRPVESLLLRQKTLRFIP